MKFDPIDFSALHDCAAKMKIIIKPTNLHTDNFGVDIHLKL